MNGKAAPPDIMSTPHTRVRAEVMYRIHEVSRLISTYFDQAVAEHGITRAQWTAIMHVSQNPGSTQSELAEHMQMGRAATGKMLDRLEQKNWIERRSDEKDSRLRRVYPHADVDSLFSFMPEAAIRLYEDFFKSMPESEIEVLLGTLNAIRGNALDAMGKSSN